MENLNHYIIRDKKTGVETEVYTKDDRVIFGFIGTYYFGQIQKIMQWKVDVKVRRAGEKEYKPLQYF